MGTMTSVGFLLLLVVLLRGGHLCQRAPSSRGLHAGLFVAAQTPCDDSNCNGLGTASGTLEDGCSCDCQPEYGGGNCGQCAANRVSWPTCSPAACTSTDCSSHGSVTGGNRVVGCQCSCTSKYNGTTCNACAYGRTGYPNCNTLAACTRAADCNNKGATSGLVLNGCTCNCDATYAGPSCNTCAANRHNYSTCSPTPCSDDMRCNFPQGVANGDLVAGCGCTCAAAYNGSTCNKCAAGRYNYSRCDPVTCTNSTLECNGRGSAYGNYVSGCKCTCFDLYNGSRCGTCANRRNPATYPACDPLPCPATYCNSSGIIVGDQIVGCSCLCNASRRGAHCELCAVGRGPLPLCDPIACSPDYCNGYPAFGNNQVEGCTCACSGVNAGPTCRDCTAGRSGPSCSPEPCSPAYCNFNGPVVGDQVSGCSCGTCASGYDSSLCGQCASSFGGYPICEKPCGEAFPGYCMSIGTIAGYPSTGCSCTCPSYAAGARCEQCAPGFRNYPTCSLVSPCTFDDTVNANSCNNHAVSMVGDVEVHGCKCVCRQGWNSVTACATCLAGFSGASCEPLRCNVSLHNALYCSNRAMAMSGWLPVAGACVCDACMAGYTGPKCGNCSQGYSRRGRLAFNCTSRTASPSLTSDVTRTVSRPSWSLSASVSQSRTKATFVVTLTPTTSGPGRTASLQPQATATWRETSSPSLRATRSSSLTDSQPPVGTLSAKLSSSASGRLTVSRPSRSHNSMSPSASRQSQTVSYASLSLIQTSTAQSTATLLPQATRSVNPTVSFTITRSRSRGKYTLSCSPSTVPANVLWSSAEAADVESTTYTMLYFRARSMDDQRDVALEAFQRRASGTTCFSENSFGGIALVNTTDSILRTLNVSSTQFNASAFNTRHNNVTSHFNHGGAFQASDVKYVFAASTLCVNAISVAEAMSDASATAIIQRGDCAGTSIPPLLPANNNASSLRVADAPLTERQVLRVIIPSQSGVSLSADVLARQSWTLVASLSPTCFDRLASSAPVSIDVVPSTSDQLLFQSMTSSVSTALAGSGMLTASSGLALQRAMGMLSQWQCDKSWGALEFMSSPTGITLTDLDAQHEIGAAVGNVAVIIGLFLFTMGVSAAIHYAKLLVEQRAVATASRGARHRRKRERVATVARKATVWRAASQFRAMHITGSASLLLLPATISSIVVAMTAPTTPLEHAWALAALGVLCLSIFGCTVFFFHASFRPVYQEATAAANAAIAAASGTWTGRIRYRLTQLFRGDGEWVDPCYQSFVAAFEAERSKRHEEEKRRRKLEAEKEAKRVRHWSEFALRGAEKDGKKQPRAARKVRVAAHYDYDYVTLLGFAFDEYRPHRQWYMAVECVATCVTATFASLLPLWGCLLWVPVAYTVCVTMEVIAIALLRPYRSRFLNGLNFARSLLGSGATIYRMAASDNAASSVVDSLLTAMLILSILTGVTDVLRFVHKTVKSVQQQFRERQERSVFETRQRAAAMLQRHGQSLTEKDLNQISMPSLGAAPALIELDDLLEVGSTQPGTAVSVDTRQRGQPPGSSDETGSSDDTLGRKPSRKEKKTAVLKMSDVYGDRHNMAEDEDDYVSQNSSQSSSDGASAARRSRPQGGAAANRYDSQRVRQELTALLTIENTASDSQI